MINIETLLSVIMIILMYIFTTFLLIPRFRKGVKVWIYILAFIGVLFPEFNGIWRFKIDLGTYALVIGGIELFEMIFKLIVERKMEEDKKVSKKTLKIFESM